MKVVVLGLDGLEVRLIKRWHLKGLMQREWGVHDTYPIHKGEDPIYTPILWSAFLMGQNPSTLGFTFKKLLMKRMKVGYGLLYPLYRIRVALFGDRKLGLRKHMMKLGLFNLNKIKREMRNIERLPNELKKKTIVAEAEKLGYRVWIKEFPSYNDEKVAELRAFLREYFYTDLKERLKLLEGIYLFSIELLKESMEMVNENDLVLYYSPLIDYANHMLYRPKKPKPMLYLSIFYRRMNRLIESISHKLKDTAILIVSDHGYDPSKHDHSRYGFWSSNVNLKMKPKYITDFKSIILDLLIK